MSKRSPSKTAATALEIAAEQLSQQSALGAAQGNTQLLVPPGVPMTPPALSATRLPVAGAGPDPVLPAWAQSRVTPASVASQENRVVLNSSSSSSIPKVFRTGQTRANPCAHAGCAQYDARAPRASGRRYLSPREIAGELAGEVVSESVNGLLMHGSPFNSI